MTEVICSKSYTVKYRPNVLSMNTYFYVEVYVDGMLSNVHHSLTRRELERMIEGLSA